VQEEKAAREVGGGRWEGRCWEGYQLCFQLIKLWPIDPVLGYFGRELIEITDATVVS
jgi:hypothetical protein